MTDEELPQLSAEIHDSELLKFAVRRDLIRLELQLCETWSQPGRLELQFLGLATLLTGSLSHQNVFSDIEVTTVGELSEEYRKGMERLDPSRRVYLMDTGTTFWMQIACDRLERRGPR